MTLSDMCKDSTLVKFDTLAIQYKTPPTGCYHCQRCLFNSCMCFCCCFMIVCGCYRGPQRPMDIHFIRWSNSPVWRKNRTLSIVALRTDRLVPNMLQKQLSQQIKKLQINAGNFRSGFVLGFGDASIQDLIDPSINCNWYQNDLKFKQKYEKIMKNNEIKAKTGNWEDWNYFQERHVQEQSRNLEIWEKSELQRLQLVPPATLWIPAVFNLNQSKFVSHINNLSFLKYGQTLYPTISAVFECMWPMFENLGISANNDGEVQTIVKMEDYILKSNGMYTKKFQKEGLDEENIIAVGIYYFDVDAQNTLGGNLEFLTVSRESAGCSSRTYVHEAAVENIVTGTCVVFSNINEIYHRLGKIEMVNKYDNEQNEEQEAISRKMLAFFVIDPSKSLSTSRDIVVNWDDVAFYVINAWCRNLKSEQNMRFVCDNVMNIIVDYVCKYSDDEKHAMRTERSKSTNSMSRSDAQMMRLCISD